MLAVTSPANLLEATHKTYVQECIIQHAELFYRHADSVMGVGPDESLYVITGCVKTDSWALAAYRDLPISHEGRVIRLVHIGDAWILSNTSGQRKQVPVYDWRERGSSEARRSKYSEGRQMENQTLFLRGFTVSFSASFVARLRKELSYNRHKSSPSPSCIGDDFPPSGHNNSGGGEDMQADERPGPTFRDHHESGRMEDGYDEGGSSGSRPQFEGTRSPGLSDGNATPFSEGVHLEAFPRDRSVVCSTSGNLQFTELILWTPPDSSITHANRSTELS